MSSEPRKSWKDVQDIIYSRILDATYGPGQRLPFDSELAKEFECARSTVMRAMQELSKSGIIERKRKGGTRVKAAPITRATFDIPSIRQDIETKGQVYGYKLISSKIHKPPLSVATNLKTEVAEQMLNVKALHTANHRPYLYEDRWISTSTVPEILEADLETQSANEWLLNNRLYSKCMVRFYAVNADKNFASIFDTHEGKALFVIERTAWIGDAPITSVKSVAHPDYQLVSQVMRSSA